MGEHGMKRHALTALTTAFLLLVGSGAVLAGSFREASPEDAARLGDSLERAVRLGERLLAGTAGRVAAAGTEGEETPSAEAGGGATVASLIVIQVGYRQPDGKTMLLWIWTNPKPNLSSLTFYANGDPVLDSQGAAPLAIPGTRTSLLVEETSAQVPLGLWECVVLGSENSRSTDSINVLGTQPFADPQLSLNGGPADPRTGLCSLELTITSTGGRPTWYSLTADVPIPPPDDQDIANPLTQDIPGTAVSHSLPGYESGRHCVGLTGWSEVSGSHYLGHRVETCSTIECTSTVCVTVRELAGCQFAFGPGDEDNGVRLEWKNGAADYERILVRVDGEERDPLDGKAVELVLEGLALGEHEVVLEPECGAGMDPSEPVGLKVTLVEAPPTVSPPTGFACRFVYSDYTRITATWKNVDEPRYAEVYVIDAQGSERLIQTLSGKAEGINVDGTKAGDSIGLRAYFELAGACFFGEMATCVPTRPPGFKYLTADCDGNSNLDLTDAIFSLDFLFRGGDEPPCLAACDSNRDVKFDLADPIYVLNHLFLSGPEPLGKYPQCDEGYPDDELPCPKETCKK